MAPAIKGVWYEWIWSIRLRKLNFVMQKSVGENTNICKQLFFFENFMLLLLAYILNLAQNSPLNRFVWKVYLETDVQ